jgi:hypothetical protein
MGELIDVVHGVEVHVAEPSADKPPLGFGSTLSEQTTNEIREIDDHIRAGEHLSGLLRIA